MFTSAAIQNADDIFYCKILRNNEMFLAHQYIIWIFFSLTV